MSVSTVNANLAHGHIKNGGEITPKLQFRRELAHDLLKINPGEEYGGGGRPQRSCTALRPFTCELVIVAHYCGMWDSSKKIEIETKVPKTTL